MNEFSFRFRFFRSLRGTLAIDANDLALAALDPSNDISLRSLDVDKTIRNARNLVVVGQGWNTLEEAYEVGKLYRDALLLTLTRLRFGADFGNRAPQPAVPEQLLSQIEAASGRRFATDTYGLLAFPTEKEPGYIVAGSPILGRVESADAFGQAWKAAISGRPDLSDRERLSHDLFHASFFQESEETRFLLLMMAIETLIDTEPYSETARTHVEHLIKLTQAAEGLAESERKSMVGRLGHLKNQSIRQAGIDLAAKRLGDRQYKGQRAKVFFDEAYEIRSSLVHGTKSFPTREKISRWAPNLEVFVSDLLTSMMPDPKV